MIRCYHEHSEALILVILTLFFIFPCADISAQESQSSPSTITFTVKTYDGLELPAQVTVPENTPKKVVVFINGSTPPDEKGNLGGSWDENGVLQVEPHQFYKRFIDTMTEQGYMVATMAKRSFVYHLRVPRPTLDELALDTMFYINELKKREILKSEDDLVIVGYSEGSTVATKVLGILKKQPALCILLGTGGDAFNYTKNSWEDWYFVDVMRKRGLPDDEIKKSFEIFKRIQTEIITIDEETFEKEWKKEDVLGIGFAPWESYHIDKEVTFYDPVPNILTSNTPILICIGEHDTAMPAMKAALTYKQLLDNGFENATFKLIRDEVHAYNKHDVFYIMDAWIGSDGATADFDPALAEASGTILEYTAHRTSGTITIDGKLEESSWKKAPFTKNFVIHTDGKEPKSPTKAQVLWDDNCLYIAFTVTDTDIWATLKNHDEHLWKEEAVEVFIDPDGDRDNYLEIQVNPLGTTLDIFMNKEYTRSGKADFSWTPESLDAGVSIDGSVDEQGNDRGCL